MKRNPHYKEDSELTPDQLKARRRLQRIEKSYRDICGALRCNVTQDAEYLIERLRKRLAKLEAGLEEVKRLDPNVDKRRTIASDWISL